MRLAVVRIPRHARLAASAGRRLRRLLGRRRRGAFVENRRRARALLARGERALAGNAPAEAETLALRALLAAPGGHDSVRLLGRALDARGHSERALDCHRGQVPKALWESRFGLDAEPRGAPAPLERTSLFGAERRELPEPGGVAEPPPGVFARRAVVAAPTFVDRVREGCVWQDAQNTLVLDRGGHALEAHTLGNPHVIAHLIGTHVPVHLGARAFVLGARGSGNYYHWMTDVLPKLELCRLAGYRFGADDRFVLPVRRAAFQLESLARFGITERQVHFASLDSPYVRAEELIVPHLRNTMGTTMGAWLPEFLKRTFLPPGERSPATRRIFISRHAGRSQGRRVTNAREIDAFLTSRGFEVVFPETLSVPEQARLFAESDVVVAPHGAGLTNIVFCSSGTRLIEFYGAHLAPCYRAISALVGLDYHAHFCLDEAEREDERARARSLAERRTAGFAIGVDAARAMLERAGVD